MKEVGIFILGILVGVGICYNYPELVTEQIERSSAAVEAYRSE